MSTHRLKVVASSFGDPHNIGTSSGVPLNFFKELSKAVDIVNTVNSNRLYLSDFFRGFVDPKKSVIRRKICLKPEKKWSRQTIDIFSNRLEKELSKLPNFDSFFEIGTNFCVNIPGVKHYARSDMTIAQAARAGFFRGGHLAPTELAEAMETQRLVFSNCDGIFVPSIWAKDSIIEDYKQNPDKIHVVGLGANLPSVKSITKTYFPPNIVFIGRDWNRKGGDILIDAFRIARKKIPEARLFIIGCSPKLQEESVSVLGHLNKNVPRDLEALRRILGSSSILCVPSRFEPFGICFVEAQLMGVVPVSFFGEGRSEAILDGVTGVLVEDRTASALADAIISLLLNQTRLGSMCETGQWYAKENFTWPRVVEKISTVMYR